MIVCRIPVNLRLGDTHLKNLESYLLNAQLAYRIAFPNRLNGLFSQRHAVETQEVDRLTRQLLLNVNGQRAFALQY